MKNIFHTDFIYIRITLVAEKLVVYTSYPIALVNRLEKHFLLTRSILKPGEKQLVQELKQWVHHFVSSSAEYVVSYVFSYINSIIL